MNLIFKVISQTQSRFEYKWQYWLYSNVTRLRVLCQTSTSCFQSVFIQQNQWKTQSMKVKFLWACKKLIWNQGTCCNEIRAIHLLEMKYTSATNIPLTIAGGCAEQKETPLSVIYNGNKLAVALWTVSNRYSGPIHQTLLAVCQ